MRRHQREHLFAATDRQVAMTVLPNPNDVLFAHKAIGLVPEIKRSEGRVLVAIIDHFNRNTGRCDPSVARLVRLLNISRASVLRATDRLSKLGLLTKVSHGGHHGCAKYQPNWAQYRLIVEQWDRSMKTGKPSPEFLQFGSNDDASLTPGKSHSCNPKRRENETQTYLMNQANEPSSLSPNPSLTCAKKAKLGAPYDGEQISPASEAHLPDGLLKKGGVERTVRRSLSEQEEDHLDEAQNLRNDANDRLNRDLMEFGSDAYAHIVEVVPDAQWQKAVTAEVKDPGSGKMILAKLIE